MSVIRHLLQPKPRDIGFPVRRLLPSALAPAVGPFVFLDHMGPFVFPDEGTLTTCVRIRTSGSPR